MAGESVAALAAAGGLAIVQAAGTDAWATVRRGFARWLGRGDVQLETLELERLDRTEIALADAEAMSYAGGRSHWEGVWQTRLAAVLESCPPAERDALAWQLGELIRQATEMRASESDGGVRAGRDLSVRADRGSVAGGVVRVEGGLRWERPFPQDTEEGSQ